MIRKLAGAIFLFIYFPIEILSIAYGADQINLIYSTNPHYPPYDWSIGPNEFEGASIELLEMVAPANVNLIPVVVPWKRALLMAEKGEIDILLSLRITPERSKFLDFTTHRAFPNPIVVFTRLDKKIDFSSWADLKKYTGGVSLGDTFGNGFDEYWRKELNVVTAPTMEHNFKKLDAGRIDYFVTGYYMGMLYLDSHEFQNKIVSLKPAISDNDIHFGFSKRSDKKSLLENMSKRLEEVDKDDALEQLLDKYLKIYMADRKGDPSGTH